MNIRSGLAQSVERWTKEPGTIMTQVQFPRAARDCSPRANLLYRLSYSVCTAPVCKCTAIGKKLGAWGGGGGGGGRRSREHLTNTDTGSTPQDSKGFFSQSTFSAGSLTVFVESPCAASTSLHTFKNSKHWPQYQCPDAQKSCSITALAAAGVLIYSYPGKAIQIPHK